MGYSFDAKKWCGGLDSEKLQSECIYLLEECSKQSGPYKLLLPDGSLWVEDSYDKCMEAAKWLPYGVAPPPDTTVDASSGSKPKFRLTVGEGYRFASVGGRYYGEDSSKNITTLYHGHLAHVGAGLDCGDRGRFKGLIDLVLRYSTLKPQVDDVDTLHQWQVGLDMALDISLKRDVASLLFMVGLGLNLYQSQDVLPGEMEASADFKPGFASFVGIGLNLRDQVTLFAGYQAIMSQIEYGDEDILLPLHSNSLLLGATYNFGPALTFDDAVEKGKERSIEKAKESLKDFSK